MNCLQFDHLQNVCMNYYEHMSFSLYLSKEFLNASIKAVVHAFIPSFYITSSTETIQRLEHSMKQIGCRQSD